MDKPNTRPWGEPEDQRIQDARQQLEEEYDRLLAVKMDYAAAQVADGFYWLVSRLFYLAFRCALPIHYKARWVIAYIFCLFLIAAASALTVFCFFWLLVEAFG